MKNLSGLMLITLLLINLSEQKILCSIDNCDEYGGICDENNTCECKENYTTLPTHKSHKFCNYERKHKIAIAFLELLVGFGMGHFYCGRKINGSIKLMIFIILCCGCFCAVAFMAKISEEHRDNHNEVLLVLFKFYGTISNIFIIWQTYDFLMFLTGVYKDGNNIPLY
jgi:hypothetical protein